MSSARTIIDWNARNTGRYNSSFTAQHRMKYTILSTRMPVFGSRCYHTIGVNRCKFTSSPYCPSLRPLSLLSSIPPPSPPIHGSRGISNESVEAATPSTTEEPPQLEESPWHKLTSRPSQQQQQTPPESGLFDRNRTKNDTDNAKRISKYQAHTNLLQQAQNPPMGTEHPVFVMTKKLLTLAIGDFHKHETSSSDWQQQQNSDTASDNFETLDHYQTSYNTIQFLLYDKMMCPNNNVRAINAAFALIERLLQEISHTKTVNENVHYLIDNPEQFRMLMNYWKTTALLGGHVYPAITMIEKLHWMTDVLQHLTEHESPITFDRYLLSMVLQVLMKQVTKENAPFLAKKIIDDVYKTMNVTLMNDGDGSSISRSGRDRRNKNALHPDTIIYAQLLKAWIDSDLPIVPSKIEEMLDDMTTQCVPLDNHIYCLLLRYWGGKGSMTNMRAILYRMETEKVEPNISSLSQVVYGYTRSMQPQLAAQFLEQMYLKTSGTGQENTTIVACTLNILDTLKRLIMRGNDVRQNVLIAEDVVRRFESNMQLKTRSQDRVHGAMMDIYAHAGRVDDVERMMDTIDTGDEVKYSILVRVYGKIDRADQAMDAVFVRMLNDPSIKTLTVHIFKALVEAWIGSSRTDAIEQAYSVFQRMDENEICQQKGLRVDSFMYGALLKVVGASKRPDSGSKVIEILDDMLQRSEKCSDKGLVPNAIIYDLALNVCFQSSQDIDSAEIVLKRMESSATPPDLRLYNETLVNYAIIGTLESAARAERMLQHIIELSKTNEALKPNAFTYNTIINAWVASKHESTAVNVWRVYEHMREAQVSPNMATLNVIINCLSDPENGELGLQRANMLLDLMESGTIAGIAPDRRHYGPIMNGWIAIGDVENSANVLMRRVTAYIKSKGTYKERCLPTPDHYYLVVNGWIRLEKLVEATEFLDQIRALHEKQHLPEGPDLYSYLTLHSAWTRSSHPKAKRYLSMLDIMIEKVKEHEQALNQPPQG